MSKYKKVKKIKSLKKSTRGARQNFRVLSFLNVDSAPCVMFINMWLTIFVI